MNFYIILGHRCQGGVPTSRASPCSQHEYPVWGRDHAVFRMHCTHNINCCLATKVNIGNGCTEAEYVGINLQTLRWPL